MINTFSAYREGCNSVLISKGPLTLESGGIYCLNHYTSLSTKKSFKFFSTPSLISRSRQKRHLPFKRFPYAVNIKMKCLNRSIKFLDFRRICNQYVYDTKKWESELTRSVSIHRLQANLAVRVSLYYNRRTVGVISSNLLYVSLCCGFTRYQIELRKTTRISYRE